MAQVSLLISTPSRRRRFFSPKSYFWLWITNFHTAHKGREEKKIRHILSHQEILRPRIFSQEESNETILSYSRNRFPNHTEHCNPDVFFKRSPMDGWKRYTCLISKVALAEAIFKFQRAQRSRIFSQRTFIVGDNWRRRCWAAIARCRIPK